MSANANTSTTTVAANTAATPVRVSPETLARTIQGAGLPVANVVVRTVPDARGTVVYIPQDHLYPGSNPADAVNDGAATTQNQIKSIVSYLTGTLGVHGVMVEGTNVGPVATDTLTVLGQKMQAATNLASAADNLARVCSSTTCGGAIAGARALSANLTRESALVGGAQEAKASGGTFALVGVENASTEAAAGDLVRDYYYLNDRLASLTTPSQNAFALANPAQLVQLSSHANTSGPVMDVSDGMLAALPKDQAIAAQTSAFTKAVQAAHSAEEAGNALLAKQAANLPPRSANPYGGVSSSAVLQQKIAADENQMQAVIVDERNRETAANAAQALGTLGTDTGVLVFGAGHTSGLLSALAAQKLSVVVVVPKQLAGDTGLAAALGGGQTPGS
ncbi:MAG TPA: hypothetical protein VF803_01690 [Candidatus Paceibacterota bacterium]